MVAVNFVNIAITYIKRAPMYRVLKKKRWKNSSVRWKISFKTIRRISKPVLADTSEEKNLNRGEPMPKDSQPDNKTARKTKANGQTPLTRENQNKNKNAKKQSVKHNDV